MLLLATQNTETKNVFNYLSQTRWIVNAPEIQKARLLTGRAQLDKRGSCVFCSVFFASELN